MRWASSVGSNYGTGIADFRGMEASEANRLPELERPFPPLLKHGDLPEESGQIASRRISGARESALSAPLFAPHIAHACNPEAQEGNGGGLRNRVQNDIVDITVRPIDGYQQGIDLRAAGAR